jgi:GAF domain-containing protein
MSGRKELSALIDLIYEAVLDNDLWPSVLGSLAERAGEACRRCGRGARRHAVGGLACQYIRHHCAARRSRFGCLLQRILGIPRSGFSASHIPRGGGNLYSRQPHATGGVRRHPNNEWWRPSEYSLATAGTSLVAEDQFSALVCISYPPGKDSLTDEQLRLFEAVVPHVGRAVRINRQLWKLELKHLAFSPMSKSKPNPVRPQGRTP